MSNKDIVSDAVYWSDQIEEALNSVTPIHNKMYAGNQRDITIEEIYELREALVRIYAANANLKSNVSRWKRLGKFKTAKAILKSDRWL